MRNPYYLLTRLAWVLFSIALLWFPMRGLIAGEFVIRGYSISGTAARVTGGLLSALVLYFLATAMKRDAGG
ncbi:MAG TPA: hypothetical protein VEX38_00830 [Fimbriimonadaceae bacterium]|nr:hypothetical protein [Fimbriimonadaceae bacterium]